MSLHAIRWKDGLLYTEDTKVPKVVYEAYRGCDSVVSLDLAIGLNTSINVNNGELYAILEDATYHWINCDDSTLLINNTGRRYTPVKNGHFAVILKKDGCTDTSACLNYPWLSSSSYDQPIMFSLYPNPAFDEVYIEWEGESKLSSLSVYNSVGELLNRYSNPKPGTLELSGLNEGLYFVELRQGELLMRKPLVILR